MLKSFNYFINESKEEEEALNDLLKFGLIDQVEYHKQRYLISPEKYRVAQVELEFDWNWAAQHESEEARKAILQTIEQQYRSFGRCPMPNGWWFDTSSLWVEDWEESDFWLEDEFHPDGKSENYGTRVICTIDLYFPAEIGIDSVQQWATDTLEGRMFSSAEVEIQD